jgi:hypothetical protein
MRCGPRLPWLQSASPSTMRAAANDRMPSVHSSLSTRRLSVSHNTADTTRGDGLAFLNVVLRRPQLR